jgi:hypothetical protein
MAIYGGPDIITDGLVLHLDAANSKSYAGSGVAWNNLNSSNYNVTLNTNPTFSANNGGYIRFSGINATLDPSIIPSGQNITISVWNQALAFQGSSLIEGTNASGTRVLNIHLPWSTAIAFWDYGDPYDRITTVQPSGDFQNWALWTFTKGGGTMSIWRNNIRLAFGNYSRSISELSNLKLGSYVNNTTYHAGNIGAFMIYNRPLASGEITQNFNALKGRFLL